MKKVISVLLLLNAISLIPIVSVADCETNKKRNCFAGCVNPRYKAISRIRHSSTRYLEEYQRDCKCSGQANAYTHHGSKPDGPYAMGYAHRNSSREWFEKEVIGDIYYPGFNVYKSFNRPISPADSTDGEARMRIVSYDRFVDEENSNDVVIDSIVGYMRLRNTNGSSLYTRFELVIWGGENSEDSIRTEEKTLWKSTITLTDEKVYGTGLFYNDNYYSIKNTDSGKVLLIHVNEEIGIDINEAVDVNVTGWSDIQSDYSEESARYHNDNENDEIYSNLLNEYSLNKFNIFPNPTNNAFRIDLSLIESKNVNIKLCDYNGKLISTIFNQEINSNENKSIDFSADQLPTGYYNLVITVGNKVFNRLLKKD